MRKHVQVPKCGRVHLRKMLRRLAQGCTIARMTTDSAGLVPEFTIADRLRKAREVTGMDQGPFAELLGVSRGTVSNYERGTTENYKPIVLRAWAMATGVSIGWIQEGGNPSGPTPSGTPASTRQANLNRLAAAKKPRSGGAPVTQGYPAAA